MCTRPVIYKFEACKDLFRFAKEVIAIGVDSKHVLLRQENHYTYGKIDKIWYELEADLNELQEQYLNETYEKFPKIEES
jgi:hypothetical protein